jgi:excisionase family DNA binding protein
MNNNIANDFTDYLRLANGDTTAASNLVLAGVLAKQPTQQSAPPPDAPLTVKEAAGRLRIGAQRVYGLCQAGTLRCLKIGRTVRIVPEEIDRFLAAQAAMPEPPPGEYRFLKLNSAGPPSPSPRRRRGSRPAS